MTTWPYRPKQTDPANMEIWYWPLALHHLYEHNLSHYDPIYLMGGSELDKHIRSNLNGTAKGLPDSIPEWETKKLWPQAIEALRKNVEWCKSLEKIYETETAGRYQTAGIDFLVTENWEVRILEISMHILHETVNTIVP